jgi:hypothetical protein
MFGKRLCLDWFSDGRGDCAREPRETGAVKVKCLNTSKIEDKEKRKSKNSTRTRKLSLYRKCFFI